MPRREKTPRFLQKKRRRPSKRRGCVCTTKWEKSEAPVKLGRSSSLFFLFLLLFSSLSTTPPSFFPTPAVSPHPKATKSRENTRFVCYPGGKACEDRDRSKRKKNRRPRVGSG